MTPGPAPDDGWAWFFHGLHGATARRRRPFDPDTLARLARARKVIDQALADELRLDDLAREACYSPFHFLRLFQAAYAETPHRYLTARRLREARRLLATTERPVGEVCRQVGFKSVGTFSRTFASAVGEPPTAYRRRVFPIVPLIRPIPACFRHSPVNGSTWTPLNAVNQKPRRKRKVRGPSPVGRVGRGAS